MKKQIKQFNELRKLGGDMRLAADGWDSEWKTLISTILSARSLDETTIKVAEDLFNKYKTIKELSNANIKDVEKIIKRVNFYITKSKNIIACSKEIVYKYNGKVPKNFDELTSLPGVGRKTANVFLSEYGSDEIPVDTHVNYISRYLEWTDKVSQEKIENDLKSLFPKSYWKKINPVLVRFGKKYTSRKIKNELLDRIKEI